MKKKIHIIISLFLHWISRNLSNVAHSKRTSALYIPIVPFYSTKLLDLILLITLSNYFAKLISHSLAGAFCNFSLLTSPRMSLISPLASRGCNYCALFQGRVTTWIKLLLLFPGKYIEKLACTILQLSGYRRLCISRGICMKQSISRACYHVIIRQN